VHHDGKRFVYVLRSSSHRDRYYVGLTSNVARRLEAHNEGRLPNTVRYRPWSLNVVLESANQEVAERFEKYLKSGSGRAFAKKHFE
jgi:putative endonuclease